MSTHRGWPYRPIEPTDFDLFTLGDLVDEQMEIESKSRDSKRIVANKKDRHIDGRMMLWAESEDAEMVESRRERVLRKGTSRSSEWRRENPEKCRAKERRYKDNFKKLTAEEIRALQHV